MYMNSLEYQITISFGLQNLYGEDIQVLLLVGSENSGKPML
jgi:hypothetical protein